METGIWKMDDGSEKMGTGMWRMVAKIRKPGNRVLETGSPDTGFRPSPGGAWAQYINRSAPCLPAHQCVWRGCCDFRSLHFTYLLDGCLYDDDLPIANLEPGVSGRNSLPLPDTPGSLLGRASRFLMPFNFCIEFFIDFELDF